MAVLIDTDVLIELERRSLPLRRLFTLVEQNEPVGIAAITLSELLAGAYLGAPIERRQRRESRIEELARLIEVMSFDVAVARIYARLWAELRQSGNVIAPHDLMIAATAVGNRFDLLTGNVQHFAHVPGLSIRQPAW